MNEAVQPEFEPVQEKSVAQWDECVDVAVVGGGAAGLCAAIAASDSGGSVLVLDRGSGLNGIAV